MILIYSTHGNSLKLPNFHQPINSSITTGHFPWQAFIVRVQRLKGEREAFLTIFQRYLITRKTWMMFIGHNEPDFMRLYNLYLWIIHNYLRDVSVPLMYSKGYYLQFKCSAVILKEDWLLTTVNDCHTTDVNW